MFFHCGGSIRLGLTALIIGAPGYSASGQIEEIVVLAQKREEPVHDVPIAVSAFDTAALDRLQIDTYSDLQFNVPNVSYTKTNFSRSNFQIRGVGTALPRVEPGVAMHINDVHLYSPRIFETEYYDLDGIEVLRGPQGTLYGRNATGGVVNLRTARPVLGELSAAGEIQLGNYEHRKAKGAVNIPIGERMAARVSGIYLDREGYTENLLTGHDIDSRDQWSVRASLKIEPADATTINVIAHYFEENSRRTRSQKQLCDRDPSPILGCLPTSLETEALNPFAGAGTLLASDLALGAAGVYRYFGFESTLVNPPDLRQVNSLNDPAYRADETFVMAEIRQQINEWLDVDVLAAHQDNEVESRQDYWPVAGEPGALKIPNGLCGANPNLCRFFATHDGGPVWFSVPGGDLNRTLGALMGRFAQTTIAHTAEDRSVAEGEQWSGEVRFATSLGGAWDFVLAGSYLEYDGESHYFVNSPGIEYPAAILAGGDATAAAFGVPTGFASLAPAMFHNAVGRFELKSWAGFGEAYLALSESVKVTAGLRYTRDEKSIDDGQLLFNFLGIVDTRDGQVYHVDPRSGVLTPVNDALEMAAAAAAAELYDAAPGEPGFQARRGARVTFDDWTGRLVVDWTPDLPWSDDSLVYVSYAKGYRSGGLNPAVNRALSPDIRETFEPEDLDAYEVGIKNTLWDRRLQANVTGFYYDYGDMQIGAIRHRTAIVENVDAEIFGAELELFMAPSENWLFDAAASFLHTDLGELDSLDIRDPAQGRRDVTTIKDLASAGHCVLEHNGQGPVLEHAALRAALDDAGVAYLPTGVDLGNGLVIPPTPGFGETALSICSALQAIAPTFGYLYSNGITTSLEGNELAHVPAWTVSLGAQYTHYLANGWTLSGRVDYYWQDESYGRPFNRAMDRIDSWDVINLQVQLSGREERWFARAFVQNLEDDDNITGLYSADEGSALFTNVFLVEPRLFGLTLGMRL